MGRVDSLPSNKLRGFDLVVELINIALVVLATTASALALMMPRDELSLIMLLVFIMVLISIALVVLSTTASALALVMPRNKLRGLELINIAPVVLATTASALSLVAVWLLDHHSCVWAMGFTH
jgi:hypothetical protein